MVKMRPRVLRGWLGLAEALEVVMSFTGREDGGMIKATPPIRCSSREAPASQVIFHVQHVLRSSHSVAFSLSVVTLLIETKANADNPDLQRFSIGKAMKAAVKSMGA